MLVHPQFPPQYNKMLLIMNDLYIFFCTLCMWCVPGWMGGADPAGRTRCGV